MGENGNWTDDDISAAFSLLGIDFDYLVTYDSDAQICKLARRYGYNNKLHRDDNGDSTNRVKKVRNLIDELSKNSGILIYFGDDFQKHNDHPAIIERIPVFIFPHGFRDKIKNSWMEH